MAESEKPESPLLLAALGDQNVPKVYANGFALGMTNADANVILQHFGRPVCVLNLSYTLAKTLAQRLQKLVAQWETRTGQQLMTTDSIDAVFAEKPDEEPKDE